jgi:4-hydroxythreonine-4-phosphate dehydrogenase
MGDPAGIGPELILKAWRATRTGAPWCVVGDADHIQRLGDAAGVPVVAVADIAVAARRFAKALPVLHATALERPVKPGAPDPANARAILGAIETATRLALDGSAGGVVTAPIAKAPLLAAGFAHPGHTEFLGALTAHAPVDGPRGPVMMLAVEGLRVVPVTIHCALADVATRLTTDAIVAAGRVLQHALARDLGLDAPRIAVAALNPHAGEDGAFGDEEARIIAPAVATLRAAGFDVAGPAPADTLFHAEARARHDAVLCMYHDQALIPLKSLDFWGGVNVTLGLPIVRTSPDHGTGFDIAGRDVARPDSLIAAIAMAHAMAARRRATP